MTRLKWNPQVYCWKVIQSRRSDTLQWMHHCSKSGHVLTIAFASEGGSYWRRWQEVCCNNDLTNNSEFKPEIVVNKEIRYHWWQTYGWRRELAADGSGWSTSPCWQTKWSENINSLEHLKRWQILLPSMVRYSLIHGRSKHQYGIAMITVDRLQMALKFTIA